ncbi:MAG TPA: macrolide ABC transporter ATP-binding protein [Lachnospiraceae bacterium]|nr:macrolide ABC transporter ATP-binding protein [Lachnospiraceae bacterium]
MDGANIISARNIVKKYRLTNGNDLTVLNDYDLDIPKGKLVMLMGRSGSGKTTLINVLSTLDDVTSGTITFEDEDYTVMSVSEKEKLRRYRMGFVFQSVALIPSMTARENIDFSLRTAGIKKDRAERIDEVLSLVGLSERGKHFPLELSGGERQRIAIARAISHRPSVIFADEPTGALDTESGIKIALLFKELTEKEGITIVMTTHDGRLTELADMVVDLQR